MRNYNELYQEMKYTMLDGAFLKEIGMTKRDMELELHKEKWQAMAALIQQCAEADGRFHAEKCSFATYAHGQYFALGKKIGSFGYSVKKKKK